MVTSLLDPEPFQLNVRVVMTKVIYVKRSIYMYQYFCKWQVEHLSVNSFFSCFSFLPSYCDGSQQLAHGPDESGPLAKADTVKSYRTVADTSRDQGRSIPFDFHRFHL